MSTDQINKEKKTPIWIETYKPLEITHIAHSKVNKQLLKNIISRQSMQHLLLHGIPGSGKTTSIHALLSQYSAQWGKIDTMFLNGSSFIKNNEEWYDVITHFFMSWNTFNKNNIKVLVIEEADFLPLKVYVVLKYLLQRIKNKKTDSKHIPQVYVHLTCNFYNKLPTWFVNEFVAMHFSAIPKSQVIAYLKYICLQEKITITLTQLQNIIDSHGSDIRSMVNYLQQHYSHTLSDIQSELNTNKNSNVAKLPSLKKIHDMMYKEHAKIINDDCNNKLSVKNQLMLQKYLDHHDMSIEVYVEKYLEFCASHNILSILYAKYKNINGICENIINRCKVCT